MRNVFRLVCALGLTACSDHAIMNGPGDMAEPPGDGSVAVTSDSATFTMSSFTVAPQDEVYWYQDFANPFGGRDAEVVAFEAHMSPGSHHMLVFYEDNVSNGGALSRGNGFMFGATPFGSQQ